MYGKRRAFTTYRHDAGDSRITEGTGCDVDVPLSTLHKVIIGKDGARQKPNALGYNAISDTFPAIKPGERTLGMLERHSADEPVERGQSPAR